MKIDISQLLEKKESGNRPHTLYLSTETITKLKDKNINISKIVNKFLKEVLLEVSQDE